jgi:hypothetical protein
MTEADVIEIMRDGLLTTVLVAGPLLAIALVVGLTIGFLRADADPGDDAGVRTEDGKHVHRRGVAAAVHDDGAI